MQRISKDVRSAEYRAGENTKIRKSQQLSDLMDFFDQWCIGCWTAEGKKISVKHHQFPYGCRTKDGAALPMYMSDTEWKDFFLRRVVITAAYHYCYKCRLPQNAPFRPQCHINHQVGMSACPFQNRVAFMICQIYNNLEAWPHVSRRFNLPIQESGKNLALFAGWLLEEEGEGSFNNTLELVLYFCTDLRNFQYPSLL